MYGEKYFIMKFIVSLLTEANVASNLPESKIYDIEALQKKMWWWCIKAEVAKEVMFLFSLFLIFAERFPLWNTCKIVLYNSVICFPLLNYLHLYDQHYACVTSS